ncbi:PQQ-dependent sugar dehydrogenase [Candidatus Pelagibacter sp.]|nr:PQQ-dependent sugar dehydrogenase [Candidatus Pelagibacter sp.]
MNLKKKIYYLIPLVIIIYVLISLTLGSELLHPLKNIVTNETKNSIKKLIFPYKYIKEQEKAINKYIKGQDESFYSLQDSVLQSDYNIKDNLNELHFKKTKSSVLNNKIFEIYSPILNRISKGVDRTTPGSGFIESYNDKLFLLSSIGIFAYADNIEEKLIFKQIRNNIEDFVNEQQFRVEGDLSIKDLKIIKDKVFLSYTNEVKSGCWNMSILVADLNYEELKFKELFNPKNEFVCQRVKENLNEFEGFQTGGRIIEYKEDKILFSTGEYRARHLAQDPNSMFGKILEIDINKKNEYKIISMGHRNPQGLLYDKENNFLISTEHGPKGGCEINLIDLSNNFTIPNYGWPIAAYGIHYGEPNAKKTLLKKKKYPLLDSHKDNGFIEPLKYFTPSIGPSEIVKIGKLKYLLATLKEKSLFFIELDSSKQIINFEKFLVGERIRDLQYKDSIIYMFMETSGSIGILK